MAFLLPLLGGLLGGAAGGANTRPPSLSGPQNSALNALISSLMPRISGTPQIDPVQQALMYGQNAQSLTGANNQVTHALVSRGLGRSGLLGAGLMQNANQSQVNQGNINLGLQQQAVGLQQNAIQQLLGALNVNNTPGQSGAGGFTAGMAPLLAYSIQNQLNNRQYNNQYGTPPILPGAYGGPVGGSPGNVLGF